MNKTLSIDKNNFKHKTDISELAFKASIDENILIVSLKQDKVELTTSLTKSDIFVLLEYLKLKGFE